jgi:hypothetical protein
MFNRALISRQTEVSLLKLQWARSDGVSFDVSDFDGSPTRVTTRSGRICQLAGPDNCKRAI